jgi:hypothetical protein
MAELGIQRCEWRKGKQVGKAKKRSRVSKEDREGKKA